MPATPSPTRSPLSIAVVGLGKMGVMHAAMITQSGTARVGALVDLDAKLGAHVRSMGVNAPWFADIASAAAQTKLDGAVIAVPSFAHRSVVESALKAGVHVFCEKPLAHSLDDARAMAELAASHPDRRCAVGFQKGHIGLFLDSAALLREGVLGEIRRFRASVYLSQVFKDMQGWTFTQERAGGGVLINTGIHLVHLCAMLFGPYKAVYCKARPMHSKVDDTLTAIVEMQNGAFGSIDMSWSVPGYEVEYTSITAEGANGVMELDDFRRRLQLLSASGAHPKGLSVAHQSETDKARFTLTPDYCGEGYYNQIADFIAAIRDNRPPRYTFEDGHRIQRVIDAFYRSSAESQRIELNPPAGLGA